MRDRLMPQQGSFSQAEYASKKKKKQTRRDKFLAEMEQVVPPAFAGAGSGLGSWRVFPRSIRKANAVGHRSLGADTTDSLFAAVVRAGRPSDGRSPVRQP